MTRVIIIGGGISGLASAWFLSSGGHDVRVLEAGAAPGGCLQTRAENGFLLDTGPTSTLYRGGGLGQLIRGVGLDGQLVEANEVARNRFIVKNGELIALPMSPVAFLGTSLFSARAKLRMLLEPFKGRARHEETVAQFVTRRLGPEFLDWAIDPFVSGVYAGDPNKLSARAATAKVYALEAESGSLFIGALARAFQGKAGGPQPKGKLISFRAGMQSLAVKIADALGDKVLLDTEVTELEQHSGTWLVRSREREFTGDALVLAVPAYRAAELLASFDAEVAHELEGVYYPPVASVALGFNRAQIRHPLDGFGMLIPRKMQCSTLGVLFSSTLFPGRATDGDVLLTAFVGGARNPDIANSESEPLIEKTLDELRPLLGIEGSAYYRRLTMWTRAIPQYELGHLERVARIDKAIQRFPSLYLRANWRDGISVSDCTENACKLASMPFFR